MAVAFPRFHDIYEQAKIHKSWGTIDDDGGKTFAVDPRNSAQERAAARPDQHLERLGRGDRDRAVRSSSDTATWKSFSAFAASSSSRVSPVHPEDLRLPHRLYKLRKAAKKRAIPKTELDEVASLLAKRGVGTGKGAPGRNREGDASANRDSDPFALTDFRASATVPHTVGFPAF